MSRHTGQLFGPDLTRVPEYRCVLLDPPWPEKGGGKIKRGADKHYPVASFSDIERIVLTAPWRAAADAHCWCWTTANIKNQEAALRLLRLMDFEPVRSVIWVKTKADGTGVRPGLGQYLRGAHEVLLLGVRGRGLDESVWQGDRSLIDVIHTPHPTGPGGKRIHSRKPAASYELIERVSKGPRIELFARTRRVAFDGQRWDVWGNQAPKEDT